MFVPSPLIRPLDNNDELIRLLCEVTSEPRHTVIQRLLDEENCVGTNVRRDLICAGVKPNVWSDKLADFYKTTKSFLYETSVWNRAPLKLQMRNWMRQFLQKRSQGRSLKVLSFGDGLGFDSAYLAAVGHDVTYYEISDECVHFAKQVFAINGQHIHIVRSIDDLPAGEFDVVVSLDVLEHVQRPGDYVALFANLLKPGGLLLSHAPFFFTSYHRVTHIRSNKKYSGCKELYRRHGLHPVDGRFFWDPIALEKSETPPTDTNLGLIQAGGLLLKLARYSNHIPCAVAQYLSSTKPKWRNDLTKLSLAENADSSS
jgi:SAM-dependent methyltransferase